METVLLIVLVLVVAVVAIDALVRRGDRPAVRDRSKRDSSITTTQKIIVDLTGRGG